MRSYRTVESSAELEIDKIKGSRFLALLSPARGLAEAQEILAARRAAHRDATHNCWAWRLGHAPETSRSSDDGEPSGTAGKPILQEIEGRRLTDVVLVVTRYFGGTKLGKGGLVRAYAEAAAAVLDVATIVEVAITRPLEIRFDYQLTGSVMGVLSSFRLAPAGASYDHSTTLRLAVPDDEIEDLRRSLVDATTGRIEFPEPEAHV
jgi:uncharacterized YigZ family protein